MTGLADMVTASQIAGAVSTIRFDMAITSFEFTPSIGISAKRFSQLADELNDLREPLTKSVEDVMTLSILENFISGGRPKWEEHAPATTERRAKEGSGSMILVKSGALAETASSKGIWSIGSTTAVIRSLPDSVWYGNIHQGGYEGGSHSAGNWMDKYRKAARKVLGPEASKQEIEKEATKIFDSRLSKHGAAPREASSIPARPFILFQDEDIDAIENIFVDWVEEQIREVGLR